jgi:C-terminal processing protease CtpA/Prc
VLVAEVAANSPADAAGLAAGDLLLNARIGGGPVRPLTGASEWRKVELDAKPGEEVRVRFDRAGREAETMLRVTPRVRPEPRHEVVRLREEERVGVVVRTATEVEARRSGLGPGGGAVVVGLARGSPWRAAGVRFGDVVVAIDGQSVASPQVVLDALRNATGDQVELTIARGGERQQLTAALTTRASEVREVNLPLLFHYSAERGTTTTSFLLGIFHYRSTAVAWRMRLLWLISFGAGDADRLVEVAQ